MLEFTEKQLLNLQNLVAEQMENHFDMIEDNKTWFNQMPKSIEEAARQISTLRETVRRIRLGQETLNTIADQLQQYKTEEE